MSDVSLPEVEETHCYQNAAFTMRYARAQGHDVDYVEGYAKIDPGIFIEHAWNAIGGVHFDATAEGLDLDFSDYLPVLRIAREDTALKISVGAKRALLLLEDYPECGYHDLKQSSKC